MLPSAAMTASSRTVPWMRACLASGGYMGSALWTTLASCTPELTRMRLGASGLGGGGAPGMPPNTPPSTPPIWPPGTPPWTPPTTPPMSSTGSSLMIMISRGISRGARSLPASIRLTRFTTRRTASWAGGGGGGGGGGAPRPPPAPPAPGGGGRRGRGRRGRHQPAQHLLLGQGLGVKQRNQNEDADGNHLHRDRHRVGQRVASVLLRGGRLEELLEHLRTPFVRRRWPPYAPGAQSILPQRGWQ